MGEDGRFGKDVYHKYSPKVSALVVVGNRVLLVQSNKDPSYRSWLPPQGDVARGVHIHQALCQMLWEELGKDITEQALQRYIEDRSLVQLGAYVNTQRNQDKPKYIVCIALRLESALIKLNEDNRRSKFVFGQYELWNQMAGTRPVKILGTCHAINAASEQGLLDWRCDSVIDQFLMVA